MDFLPTRTNDVIRYYPMWIPFACTPYTRKPMSDHANKTFPHPEPDGCTERALWGGPRKSYCWRELCEDARRPQYSARTEATPSTDEEVDAPDGASLAPRNAHLKSLSASEMALMI